MYDWLCVDSATPLRIRSFNSWREATRMCLRNVLAIFPNSVSARLSHDPCLGVRTYLNRLGCSARLTASLFGEMSGVVVKHDSDDGFGGIVSVQILEQGDEFDTAMARFDSCDDVSVEQMRIPAKPITIPGSCRSAIREDADHHRSEATLACFIIVE